MADKQYRLLRGRITEQTSFQTPRNARKEKLPLPPRNRAAQKQVLLNQLDALLKQVQDRDPAERVEGAAREIIAVQPEAHFHINADGLGSKPKDVRVISEDPDTGVVIVDASNAELPHLRKKIEDYADPTKKAPKSDAPKHEGLVAPIKSIGFARAEDLCGSSLKGVTLVGDDWRWLELVCRGGTRRPESETLDSRKQIIQGLLKAGVSLQPAPQEYIATECVVYYVRLTFNQLRKLIAAVDCIYEFDAVSGAIRDWLFADDPPVSFLRDFKLDPPPQAAPSVVLLDTGIRSRHPLLQSAILSTDSIVPGIKSVEDTYGHGTLMAGAALFEDLGKHLSEGGAKATHWLQSVKLLNAPLTGTAAAGNQQYWPTYTKDGVEAAEGAGGDRRRVFAMALTSEGHEPSKATYWSHAVDQLAYNFGHGRLLCVPIGNADVQSLSLIHGYPTLNLDQGCKDPSHALNALTVGAYTGKTILPGTASYYNHQALAPAGGISPHTCAGVRETSRPIKPDVVFEGGNIAFDGLAPDPTVGSLTTLTTHKDHEFGKPLGQIYATSGATANAARMAAQIWTTENELRPESVRGLIVHSASWTPQMYQQFPNLEERLSICGYGVPDLTLARQCARERATVIIEDAMPNGVIVQELRVPPPKRPTTSPFQDKLKRMVKYFRLPLPEDELQAAEGTQVELRVTLSYFAEPNTIRRRVRNGLDLRWDMQGPSETEPQFQRRINRLERGEAQPKDWLASFDWEVGIQRRSRGTVQSDRWVGDASFLAGDKLLCVYPALGWWEQREALKTELMPFSLIVTVRAPGLDIYNHVQVSLTAELEAFT